MESQHEPGDQAVGLGADLGASAAQLLQHALDSMGARVTLVLVAAVRCPGRETVSSAGLVAFATRQRGSRAAASLDEVGMIGQEFYCADSAIKYRILAGMRRCGPRGLARLTLASLLRSTAKPAARN